MIEGRVTLATKVREGLSEEMTFGQESEGGKGAGHWEKWGNSALDRGNSKCKGLEAGTH